MKKCITLIGAASIHLLLANTSSAQEQKSLSQLQFEASMRQADETHKRLQQEQQREKMRDTSHDFPRIKVGDGVSVGGDFNPPQVNIRVTK